MTAYLVRTKEGQEIVGVFSVRNTSDLFCYVDHCCDPHMCEFMRLPDGGVFWGGKAPSIPLVFIDECLADKFPQPDFTDEWNGVLLDGGEKWHPIPYKTEYARMVTQMDGSVVER